MNSIDRQSPIDQSARKKAVDPTRSCIVQAPAGSGKTTLLVQRYLNLLEKVNRPEEILAITFTRKAATEMKQRILNALDADNPLAQRIRQRDADAGWGLRLNPNRLKVQTIDSFAMELATRIPKQTSVAGLDLVESADHLYQQAGETLLQQLAKSTATAPVIAEFLAFLNNDAASASKLLTNMLARRDQWLDINNQLALQTTGATGHMQKVLQHALTELRAQVLQAADGCLTAADRHKIQSIYKALYPEATSEEFHAALSAIAPLLLTTQDSLRKSIDRRAHSAFADKSLRDEVKNWLPALASTSAAEHFKHVKYLPSGTPTDTQCQTLATMSICLSLSAIALNKVFVAEGAIDFTELQLRATAGLRDESGPTDLALYFDYKIRHLLVDEFQDTSHSQLHFFELLTEGWQADDNNTFFAVGDPMQSIYRFRDADVSLFAQCREHGLAGLPLERLDLIANFRSAPDLVNWSNDLFSNLLPPNGNARLGAVNFAASQAFSDTTVATAPVVCRAYADAKQEVREIIAHLRDIGSGSVGILCRSRSHLQPLVSEMTAAGIPWRSTDIDLLAEVPVIQDLMNVHRIMQNPEDRLAWFSILRSPLIGLRLTELQQLHELQNFVTELPALKNRFPAIGRLTDGLDWARTHLYEFPLREILEGLWVRLGGFSAYDEIACEHALHWFELIEELGRDAYSLPILQRRVARLFANRASTDQIEVMTIHKAKGLEFDHVIVPFLQRGTRHDQAPLMLWQRGDNSLLIGAKEDPIHAWLHYEEKIRATNERKRLLYVACTRARSSLWLSYQTDDFDKAKDMADWIKHRSTAVKSPTTASANEPSQPLLLTALPAGYQWRPPPVNQSTIRADTLTAAEDLIGGRFEIALGHLVHKALAWLGSTQPQSAKSLPDRLSLWAAQQDIDPQRLTSLIAVAQRHISTVLDSTTGQWMLAKHSNARCEWAISGVDDTGRVHNAVLDRYFESDAQRWIIDYKTAMPAATDQSSAAEQFLQEQFLQEQKDRYQFQLKRYHTLVERLFIDDPKPIRTALYFTGLGELHEL